MRVNVYAEEMTQRVELVRKGEFTGIRFYLELPVALSTPAPTLGGQPGVAHISGPFVHKPGGDDSAAVTFWGKRHLKGMLIRALQLLDQNERPATAGELDQASTRLNATIAMESPSLERVYASIIENAQPFPAVGGVAYTITGNNLKRAITMAFHDGGRIGLDRTAEAFDGELGSIINRMRGTTMSTAAANALHNRVRELNSQIVLCTKPEVK